jgi:hypothetical protein
MAITTISNKMELPQLKTKTLFAFLLIIIVVVGLSILANRRWQQKPESAETEILTEANISEQMTIRL